MDDQNPDGDDVIIDTADPVDREDETEPEHE